MLIDPYAGRWETRVSSRGHPYQVWQPLMPWISPETLECAAYLYPSEADAEDGNQIGGSGFLIGIPIKGLDRTNLICLVTNRHVIDGGSMVVRLNTRHGKKDIVPLDRAKLFVHPDGDDLAMCPIRVTASHQVRFVPTNRFLTKAEIEQFEIGPGDEVYVVGRFVNHEGRQRNLPSVRFGNIAQMPWEPIMVDGYPQETFLVEAKSIAGYSGSPVFVYLPPPPIHMHQEAASQLKQDAEKFNFDVPGVSRKRIGIPFQLGPWLLGVDYCHIRSDEPVFSATTQRQMHDWFVKTNTGMMGVVPAWKLTEMIKGPEMKPIIENLEKQIANRKKAAAVEPDAAAVAKSAPPVTEENPNAKEDFNRLLDAAAQKPKRDDQT